MWMFHCCLLANFLVGRAAYYHELSMATITPPSVLPKDSFFGYSVTYYNNELIVSAPRADLNGHVYSCALDKNTCTLLDIMKKEPPRVDSNGLLHNHTFWLGATVKANKHALFVCAPRTTEFINKETCGYKGKYFGTTGTCYGKDLNNGAFKELLKIEEKRCIGFTRNENLTDSFGWSIDIQDKIGPNKYFTRVGSPALARGRVMTYENAEGTSTPDLFLHNNKNGFNFGYSIASGNFFKKAGRVAKVAIGTPYGDNGIGKVLFYLENNKPTPSQTVIDPTGRVGSLFGAALCTASEDRNKKTDLQVLLVGAPATFHDYSYHTGAVYVYKQDRDHMANIVKIDGPNKNGAFFGYAIVNVGDLDHDGKDEIVIAAPYEDDGKGAVYLYSGSSFSIEGKDLNWLQRFQPKVPEFQNFGLSLTANRYSENGCYGKDLAIGAPGDGHVAVYHCLTVIKVNMDTVFPELRERADKTKFDFSVCLNGEYPDKPEDIQASFSVRVKIAHPNATLTDAKPSHNYVEFDMKLNKKTSPRSCRRISVTTIENGDYEQEIQFEITATLQDDPIKSLSFSSSRPTLSADSLLKLNRAESVAECEHKTCKPKLTVDLDTNIRSPYVIGSSETEKIEVVVHNGDGDTAYRPCVRVTVASEGAVSLHRVPQHCSVAEQTATCWLQKPLKRNSEWLVSSTNNSIEISLTGLTNKDRTVNVTAEVLNRCTLDAADHVKTFSTALTTDSSGVRIDNKTDQGEIVTFNSEDVQNGRTLHHTYTITNTGRANWIDLHSVIRLYKRPYISFKAPIQVYSGETLRQECEPNSTDSKSGFDDISCPIGDLYGKQTIVVVIPITVEPGALEDVFKTANGTAETSLSVKFELDDRSKNEITTLRSAGRKVPLWMIIASAAVGFLILFLIAFALYECGFLRRQNKQKLENLQKEVKRKSMALQRQSVRLTESAKAELRNLTFRQLLDHAELQEAEEATEPKEENTENIKHESTIGGETKGDSNLNGESSVSNLNIRAQLEKTLQQKPKGHKSYKVLSDDVQI